MIIDARDVSWVRADRTILHHVDWQIQKGEYWSLVGLNGSGKTTLLKMINGYIWPTSGSLSVLNKPFGSYDLRELRKKIGWVSSALSERIRPADDPESIVLSGRFASIGLYDSVSPDECEKAQALLNRLGCSSFAGRAFGLLSQGERQRVLIARALMADPELLILDEPCNGLDLFAREQLLSLISRLAHSAEAPSLIFVTHHVEEILPCFEHTLLLKAGTVFKSGKTGEVMTPEVMTDFYDHRVSVQRRSGRLHVDLCVHG
ncbi:ABC transporter ATP-binding protein [Sporolactobacillus sp. THM19-2]|jgi:iron complex transport system ATP-binding protein|uniref:ABC transporter ATP-binding protein n=1 Tax=Sporolactobacillus sp. THM19-2 TaxID=2511171 RepID=UPI001020FAB8|nr:ABC transporter ATP-binding protein [Sporolactobacillus sp. THM19-2]RYL87267.1 ABC transporter ATP-binding protein [Sporolactobacillus sp. THM19-2]